MRPLILGVAEREMIAALVDRAAKSVVPFGVMRDRAAAFARGHRGVPAQHFAQTIRVPVGFDVTLTYEEHRPGERGRLRNSFRRMPNVA